MSLQERKAYQSALLLQHMAEFIFAELKTDKGVLPAIQKYIIGQMLRRNADVRVLYGLEHVRELLREIETDSNKGSEIR